MPRHDVCIVGLKCYDLLARASVPRYLGGIEKLLVTMARGLSQTGADTAFITYDHGQPDAQVVDGITVYKAFSDEAGLPGVRFFHPRMTGLWCAMRRANAAIYIQMGAGSEAGRVALGAHHFTGNRKAFVFSLASDKDADRDAIRRFPLRERLLYQYGLRSADLLISQTQTQREALLRSFGHESTVLPMPIESPDGVDVDAKVMVEGGRHRLLWVGRIIETKRLELLFKVARRCSDVKFDVVGTPNRESRYYQGLVREAEEIENVTLHGRVAEGVLPRLYRESTLLLCTSILEGFPTTFLEAWSYAMPVITTFDPDGVVAENKLGEVVETEDEIVDAIRRFTSEMALRQQYCSRVRQYFEEHYTLDAILPKFRSHLKSLTDIT
jgi:glycosyltransferase involved in cell wall biosynthesis